MSQVSDSNSYSTSLQRQQDSYDAERAESRKNNEAEIQKVKDDSAKALSAAQKDFAKQLHATRAEAQDEVRKLKEEMYDSKGKRFIDDARVVTEEKQQLRDYKDQIDKEVDRKVDAANDSAEARATTAESNESRKVAEVVMAQKKSQVNQLKDIHQHQEMAEKAHENQIQQLKNQQAQLSDSFSARVNEAEATANERAEKQIGAQKSEFSQIEAHREQDLQHLQKQFQTQLAAEKQRNQRSTGTLIGQSNDATVKALIEKDGRYEEYLKTASQQHQAELGSRDEEIKKLRTTADMRDVSPVLLQKLEDKAARQNYAESQELKYQNQMNLDSVRKRDFEERRDLKNDFAQKYTAWNKENQKGHDVETKSFLGSYTDLQNQKDSAVAKLEQHQAKTFQSTTLKHAQEMNLLQARDTDAMQAQREDFHSEKSTLQNDHDFQQKVQDREWTMKFNDMRRDYEKKMGDERDQHEMAVSEMKLDNDKKLRDQERRSTHLTDDRVKAYEYQIKQQELAFKEKERFLTEHYEEELARMRSTNARITQKKS